MLENIVIGGRNDGKIVKDETLSFNDKPAREVLRFDVPASKGYIDNFKQGAKPSRPVLIIESYYLHCFVYENVRLWFYLDKQNIADVSKSDLAAMGDRVLLHYAASKAGRPEKHIKDPL